MLYRANLIERLQSKYLDNAAQYELQEQLTFSIQVRNVIFMTSS